MKGVDYSWDRPDLNCLWNQGVRFIVRYGSRDPSKNLSRAEIDKALSLGMSVAVVWQEGKTQMLRGYSGGQTDAREADALFRGLGLGDIPIHFSCDQDYEACPQGDKDKIDAYCDGALSIVSKSRMGGYGDDSFCKRQFDTGRMTYGWQTYAWSEGMWEPRCQLRQVKNNVSVCGGLIDWDESWAADFGQYPRPSGSTGTGVEDMTPAVAFDNNNKQCRAFRGADGNIYYSGPETSWGWITIGATAKSGVDLAIREDTTTVISYINGAGHYCTYTRPAGKANWDWADCGGQA